MKSESGSLKGKRPWLIGIFAAFVAVWFLFIDTYSFSHGSSSKCKKVI
jgi:hypothetical protein